MTHRIETYIASAAGLEILSGRGARGLAPVLGWADGAGSFVILDTFELGVRTSQRLLLDDGHRLALIPSTGETLTQPTRPGARFVAGFAAGAVRSALAGLSPLRALLPVATGTMRSGRLALVDDEGKSRVRADLRELRPTDGNAVLIVTVQGLRGYRRACRDLIALVRDAGGLPLASCNPYRMIDPARTGYTARPQIGIGRDESALEAGNDLIVAHLAVARANESGVIDDLDTEFLHDYRIALRKIRSVLSLFKGVYDPDQNALLKARFSALMAPTGRLRDLDVYLLEQDHLSDLLPPQMQVGLDRMFALLKSRRAVEQSTLATHLGNEAYQREIGALQRLFATQGDIRPGPNASRASYRLACELSWKRYRRIGRIARDLTPVTPDEDIHALRIECKKLRYLLEFFAPVFPAGDLGAILKAVRRLQDSLGVFNDCAVQQAGLRAFADDLGDVPHRMDIVQSLGALITVLHQKQAAEREKIVAAFARFNSDRTRRIIRRMLHAGKGS